MSAEALVVEKRDTTGTLRIRRLRKEGKVPAVLYGHGQENVNLSIDGRALTKMVDHGHYVVALSGAVNETAMIKEVQWNAFGSEILHIDLARVDAAEAIEVSLTLNLKGDAPGAGLGGMVAQLTHEIKISCPANLVPDFLEVSIDKLGLDDSVTAGDIELPKGASLVGEANEAIVTCTLPRGETAPKEGEAPSEPEVIGEKKEDGDE